jgi:teichoic acid transport system permease protein
MSFFVLGLSYITSACTAFFRDMTQIINIVLTIGVWITPIMWNPVETLSPALQTVFRLNPMYYIVDGFRDALLAKAWFWDKPVWTIYFWTVCILIYLLGLKMFNRLKVHFADVL